MSWEFIQMVLKASSALTEQVHYSINHFGQGFLEINVLGIRRI
jgi:hypothetical protein